MELKFFEEQMLRLQDQWPHSFSNERKLRIWTAIGKHPEGYLEDAVTYFLNTFPKAPLLPDFEKYVSTWTANQNLAKQKAIESDPAQSEEAKNCKRCKSDPNNPGLVYTLTGVARCSCPLGDLHPKEFPRLPSSRRYTVPENQRKEFPKPFGEKD